jgi:predicted membrane metal-binding protein
MYDPYALLHDASLHLSFLATYGIVYGVPLLESWWNSRRQSKVVHVFAVALLPSLAAYCATAPYIMYAFGNVSPYALLANIVVTPLVPVAMASTAVAILVSFVTFHGGIVLGFLASILHGIIIFIAVHVASLPLSSIAIHVSYTQMVVMYACMGIGLYVFHTTRGRYGRGGNVSQENNKQKSSDRNAVLTDTIAY